MKPKKILTLLTLIVAVLFIYYATNAMPLISDSNFTYLSGMKWYKTYDEGARVAKQQNKPMFVYFWTIWCLRCEKLQTDVFPKGELMEILRRDFVLVAVDMDIKSHG